VNLRWTYEPPPLPADRELPAESEVDRTNSRVLQQLGAWLAVAAPVVGATAAAIGRGRVSWVAGLFAMVLLGTSVLCAVFAILHSPRVRWEVPAADQDAFARRQAGIVLHRQKLARAAVLLLALSLAPDLVAVIQSYR
jgi:hypothetical protein